VVQLNARHATATHQPTHNPPPHDAQFYRSFPHPSSLVGSRSGSRSVLNPFSIFSLPSNKSVRTADTTRPAQTAVSQGNARESATPGNPFLFKPAVATVDISDDSDDAFNPNPQSLHNLARLFGSSEANFSFNAPTASRAAHDRPSKPVESTDTSPVEGDRLASARAKLALYVFFDR
jgi:hypothetical protein